MKNEYGVVNHFRARVEVILARRGWTQLDLARALGVRGPSLVEMLNRGHPLPETIARVARALGVSAAELTRPVRPEEYGACMIPRLYDRT